jgi:Cu+-exporting ATPase
MKKIIDKIINEEGIKEKENDKEVSIGCDCCCSSESTPLATITTDKKDYSNKKDQIQTTIHNGLSNEKLLIAIGLVLTIPIVLLDIIFSDSYLINVVSLALATPVQVLLGKPFYVRFIQAIKHKKGFTTDTLVVLSTSIAYFYSLATTAMGSAHGVQFFEASASVLTIFTIGEYLEGRVLRTTSESIKNLLALRPKTAVVIRTRNDKKGGKEDEEIIVDADSIVIGDIVVAKPGDKIAADGIVVYGESSVDESMITGESIPVYKKIGDKVIGATINKNGYIRFRATAVGSHTILAGIIELVERARVSKAPVQRIADKAVRYFIPIVLFIAATSSFYWFFVGEQSIAFAITIFATVLVVSCPCALGIATPMVVSLGIGRATREGILIKDGEYLEKLANIDTVIFDKTGTLTKGKPEVTNVISNNNNINGYTQYEILQIASSLENRSEHPIAQAITSKASEQSIPTLEVSQFNSISGHGIMAFYQDKRIFVGSLTSATTTTINNGSSIIPQRLQSETSKLEAEGKTVVAVFIEDKLVGLIAVADTLRDDAKHTIDEIKRMNKEIILMSGDNKTTAKAIANKLGMSNVLAQVTPETKAQEVKKLQDKGRKVAMIGDGINDAPALTQADVGIAMGSGTDVAMSSGDIILMKSDLYHVLSALKIGKYSFKKIKQNLAMSFAYNAITISIAAGLLYGVTHSVILTPALAALGWIISDSAVFGNSLLVRKYSPNKTK